jgi:hypothetical protein
MQDMNDIYVWDALLKETLNNAKKVSESQIIVKPEETKEPNTFNKIGNIYDLMKGTSAEDTSPEQKKVPNYLKRQSTISDSDDNA